MNAWEGKLGGLEVAVFLVRVPGGHVEGLVDFEAPGAALDGLEGRHFREEAVTESKVRMMRVMHNGLELEGADEPVHTKLHFLLVVRDRGMDLMKLHPDFRANIPPQRGADHPSAKMVVACLRIAEHDGEVLGDVVEHDEQGVFFADIGLQTEEGVVEEFLVLRQREVLWVARAEELQRHLHEFLTSELGTREPLQNGWAVFGVKGLALRDACDVVGFEFEPPVRFEFGKGHGLVVGPAEGAIGSSAGFGDVEVCVGFWEVDAGEGGVVGEVAEGFYFFDREAGGSVFVFVAFPVVVFECHHRFGECLLVKIKRFAEFSLLTV